MSNTGKRVVVVGGTGNISTSISRLLVEQGYDVTCYNRGKNRAEALPPQVHTLYGDRNDREAFERTMQQEKFDYAIDMICFGEEDAASDIRAFRDVEQFVMCSTTCTYGVDYAYLPADERHPLRPITPYGINKAAADKLFLDAYKSEGFPVTIIKPSTTYGNQVGLVSNVGVSNVWIDRMRKGKPILLCGNGNTPHQFLHVDDAAKGFVGALGKKHCIGEMYNLVREGFTPWSEYYETGRKVLGVKEADYVCVPVDILSRTGYEKWGFVCDIFAFNCYYDHSKIYRDIPEFRPSVSLEEGMRAVIAYLDATGGVPDSAAYPMDDEIAAHMKSCGGCK